MSEPEILECGCLKSVVVDEGLNEWAGKSPGTEFEQTIFCEKHRGTFTITEPVEGYAPGWGKE